MADFNSSQPVRTQNNGDVVIQIVDGTTTTQKLAVDASGRITSVIQASGSALTATGSSLNVNLTGGTIGVADKTAFTYGTTVFQPIGGVFQDTSPTLTAGTSGAVRLTTNRGMHSNLRTAAGVELLGSQTSANSIPVVIASDQGAIAISEKSAGPVTPGTVATNSDLIGGQFNTVLPTLTTGQQSAIQIDSSGRLLVNISASAGSISVTQGTSPWVTSDLADGSVAAGTAGTKSMLAGVIFNTSLPTLTTGQQAAVQADSSGRILIGSIAAALPAGTNSIGTVVQGNAGSAAQGWFSKITDGTNTAAVKASTTAAAATDPALVVSLSPNSPTPTGTNVIGSVGIQVSGAAVSATNPVYVTLSDTVGTSVDNYNTAASIAAAATSNHDYTVTAAKTFYSKQFWASASGKLKIEVQYETGSGTGVFNSFWVGFNSTSNPDILIPIPTSKTQVAGAKIRIIRTNLDLLSQDVYSTTSGTEQ